MASCLCTEGQIVHALPEGEPVNGVTSLGEEIYVLRGKCDGNHIEVFDVNTYQLKRYLTVPNSCGFIDMTACEHFRFLYIADHNIDHIHRLNLQGNAEHWPVNAKPTSLSVNAKHNLIVTCYEVRKIKEFSPRGHLLRDVTRHEPVARDTTRQ